MSAYWLCCIPQAATLLTARAAPYTTEGVPGQIWFPNALILWPNVGFLTVMLLLGAGVSVLFSIGFRDRLLAVILWYLWACLASVHPLLASSRPWLGWFFLVHVCCPAAPYGAWDARQRPDPNGDWAMPQYCFLLLWLLITGSYSAYGIVHVMHALGTPAPDVEYVLTRVLPLPPLLSPDTTTLVTCLLVLQIGCAPLLLWRHARPWLWCAMLVWQGGSWLTGPWLPERLTLFWLHLLLLDPAWIPPLAAPRPTLVFYDCQCGLCHRAVRFALAEERTGQALRFAPLYGEAWQRMIPIAQRQDLPDSLIVVTPAGLVQSRSAAIMHVGQRLGGLWRVLAMASGIVPSGLRDTVYDTIAALRSHLFRKPEEVCPLMPASLRNRFEL